MDGDKLEPGDSAIVSISAGSYVSAVSMLVTTKDVFFALNGVIEPEDCYAVHLSPAYDAGSEANNDE